MIFARFSRLSSGAETRGHGHPGYAPRVLLLTFALGSGHLRAAQAVEAALRECAPVSPVLMIDFWSLLDEGVAQALQQAYLRLVQERPELYDRLYRLDQRTWRDILEGNAALPTDVAEGLKWFGADLAGNAWPRGAGQRLDRVLFRLFLAVLTRWARAPSRNGILGWLALIHVRLGWGLLAWRLHARLRAFRPDVVVATQMYPAALLSFLKARRRLRVPALGAVTDFGMHDFWHQPGIDLYCVAHESIVAAAGLSADRIVATGMPLMPGFRHPPDGCAARARLRLAADAPVVLVLGGGLGLGVDAMAARLLAGVARAQVLVFAGHNASAHEALAGLSGRYPGRLSVCGWTDEPEVFLRAADVVVGKPGGLTLAEALACGRPLLAMRSLGGQESFNTRFLEQYGVGRLLADDELVPAVESLLGNPGELARIQQRIWALGARDGATRIAQTVLALAQVRSDAATAPAQQEGRARRLAQRCLGAADALYHAWHRLRPVGEVLYVGRARYRGPVMAFPDGTRLAPGDFIGILHLNNARFLKIEAGSPERVALQFARLMVQSVDTLADRARLDPWLADLPAFQGISWFKPHGRRAGFITAPFPDGPRKRMMTAYFRFLVWTFAPAARTRAAAKPTPTVFWLTREQLLRHHGKADEKEENRT